MHPEYGPAYRSPRAFVPWLIGLTVLGMAAQVAMAFLPQADPSATPAEAFRAAMVTLGLMALVAPIGIAQVVVALMWFHRAHANLQALGAPGLKWSPGWAVGAWFIPFANYVIPFMIIAEQWKASHPDGARRPWTSLALPAWIVAWWVVWVLQAVVALVGTLVVSVLQNTTGEAWSGTALAASLTASALYIVAGVFFLNYVSKVTAFQDDRSRTQPAPAPAMAPART